MNNILFQSVDPLRSMRRVFTWRNARRALLGVAGLVTLITAVFVIEGWRGRRAWAEAEALARSRGEPLTLAEIMPPLVPDEKNLARIPLLAPLFGTDEAAAKAAAERWRMPAAAGDNEGPGFDPVRYKTSTGLLNAWRACLGTENLLAYLDRYEGDLAEVTTALQRPGCRFPVRQYGKPFGVTTAHVAPMLHLSRLLYLRALARVERGQSQGAAEDVVTMLRVAKALDDEPLLLSQLVGKAIADQSLHVLGFGLTSSAWSEADLAMIEAGLAKLDLVAGGWRALRGEMVFALSVIEEMAAKPGLAPEMMGKAVANDPSRALFYAVPSGWFDQNRAHHVRFYVEDLLPAYDTKNRRMDCARLHAIAMALTKHSRSPYWFFTRQSASIVDICPLFAMTQTQVDFARIAIALDRWRWEKGSYPAALSEVIGAHGLAGLHDFFTGEPFRYRLNADGTYLLYATGRDGTDNGGKGDDWVWSAR